MRNNRRAFLRQQAALDAHREVLAATRQVVAEWAARHGGARDPEATAIIELLAELRSDTNGDKTLDVLGDIFAEHGEMLSPGVIMQLADLGQRAHDMGRLRGVRYVE